MKTKILHSLILVLILALIGICVLPACSMNRGDNVATDNASFHFDEEEILRQLKEQNIDAINKDLIKTVQSNKLSGPVNVIVTLSQGSLLGRYNQSGSGELADYLSSAEARTLSEQAIARQNKVEAALVSEGLTSQAKYHYSNILDGFAVSTTYENLARIVNHDGVYGVIICNTYEAQEAVTNDVNVYETGIFQNNVSDKYTGKGTLVAILDTGCDYAHPAFTTHQVQGALHDRDTIAAILAENDLQAERLNGGSLEAREVYYGNLTKDKIAFGYDYADQDSDVMPFLSEHGTHVAGIIGGYADDSIWEANDDFDGSHDTTLRGVAIDAQLAIMKVFSDYRSGAEDEDILAALEDCVALGVDAINMSLGSSCGFTREYDDEAKNTIYDSISNAGISLIVAASNDYSSGYGSEFGNTNFTHNPDSGTVGSPATYQSALSVASINGNMDKYITTPDGRAIFFQEAANMGNEYYDFFDKLFERLGVTGDELSIEYVTVPGLGAFSNYGAIDVRDKIALVQRGDLSFEDKAINAALAGAAGVIIYNNLYGDILMTVGEAGEQIGVCSIGKDDGEYLAKNPSGTLIVNRNNKAGPFMSDFSSWGPNPDLTLKPEITAHGGNIWSAIPGGGYEKLSGTSMACPNLVGIAVLARQYVAERFADEELSPTEKRDLVNQLMMSTATIALNQDGNPYSPRKQGAGIADILKLTTTDAYLFTKDEDGAVMSTTKLELGDDATRKGEYTMTFYLRNISDGQVRYKLGSQTFTESLSADKKYVAERAYMLGNAVEYKVTSGGTLNGSNIVTVPAKGTAEITVKITLSDADKQYLNNSFENGMYVEGFVTLDNQAPDGVDLNVPFLAFYGDWGKAPIFDKDYYEVETTAHNNAIDDEDKIKADYVATTPYALYYYDYIIPMGTYLYNLPYGYNPIPATQEHAALSYQPTTLNAIYAVYAGLLRGARELDIQIRNSATGEVVWTMTDYNCFKAHWNGSPMPYVSEWELPMFDFDALTLDMNGNINGAFGYNNDHFDVTMTAKLDWDNERNVSDTYTFGFYIDTEAPTITGYNFRSKYNNSTRKWQYYVDLEVYDNHYAQSLRPIVVGWALDENGEHEKNDQGEDMVAAQALGSTSIPVYQTSRGSTTKVEVEITDYMDNIRNSLMPNTLMFQLDDFALNTGLVCIPLPESDNENLGFDTQKMAADGVRYDAETGVTLDIGQTLDLTKYVVSTDPDYKLDVSSDRADTASDHIENYLFMLNWASADSTVATAESGVAEALAQGTTDITFESGGVTHTLKVTVTDQIYTGANEKPNTDRANLEEIKFTGYKTLFAFTSDIDRSDIGETGDEGYFGSSAAISFYPSEKVQLRYQIKPWNLAQSDRYTLVWRTTNPDVATVDQDGNVTAEAEGNCAITLSYRDKATGRENVLQASCAIQVKSEFIINDSRQLVAYKGKGGEVTLPDDEGLMYINSFAFCHYEMDNEIELPEDDKYNLDLKRIPYRNETITKVIIPDTVTTIEFYAFGNCVNLQEVVIGDDSKLTTIGQYAFAGCEKLEKINLNMVHMINDYAFQDCVSLYDVGTNKLARPYGLGISAFEHCLSLKELDLANLRRGREDTFKNCEGLTTLTLGGSTRLCDGMFEGCTSISKTTDANGNVVDITASNPLVINSDVVADNSFAGCTALQGVRFTREVTYVGANAFADCTDLRSVTFENGCAQFGANAFTGCKQIGTFAVKGAQGYSYDGTTKAVYNSDRTVLLYVRSDVTDFELPASVREIANGAFSGATGLNSFGIAAGSQLERIGDYAFYGCESLASVQLPNSVNYIGTAAFAGTGLGSVQLEHTAITSVSEGTFAGVTTLANVTLPENCTTIGDSAFEGCSALRSIDLSNVTAVGNYAFYGCNLSELNFKNDVTIGTAAFAAPFGFMLNPETESLEFTLLANSPITSVTFDKKANIGAIAFAGAQIEELVIDADGSTIGDYAFYGCQYLATANIDGVEGKLGDYAFAYCSIVDVQSQSITGLGEISMNNVDEIGESAFEADMALTTVHSRSLTKVGNSAFYPYIDDESMFYMNLAQIDLNNVVEIGRFAFMLNRNFTSLTLPALEKIGARAFLFSNLVSLQAANLKEIESEAFAECESFTTLTAPKLEKIGPQAFVDTPITSLEVNDCLVEADGAMAGAQLFGMFTHNGNVTYIGQNIRLDGGALYLKKHNGYVLASYPASKTNTTYKVIEGTTRIGYMAAWGNSYLQSVTLPYTLRSIGDYAFYDCDRLSTVVFNSYYAPTLEGVANVNQEIHHTLPEGIDETDYKRYGGMLPEDLPYMDELYKYDFYYQFDMSDEISYYYGNLYNYRHFVGLAGSVKLTMQIPVNSSGYDSPIYKAYFNESPTKIPENMGRYAVEFTNAVQALRDLLQIDRYATVQINNAITAYNMLQANNQLHQANEDDVDFYFKALNLYNVDTAYGAITSLTDMDDSVLSYKELSNAWQKYNQLSSEEKLQLDERLGKSARTILDEKSADYKRVSGFNGDVTKDYSDHVVDLLQQLFGDLKPEDITENDFGKLVEAYNIMHLWLSDDEIKDNETKLAPYQAYIDVWNKAARNTGVISTAETIARAPVGALFATAASFNALLVAAYVALKGGIL